MSVFSNELYAITTQGLAFSTTRPLILILDTFGRFARNFVEKKGFFNLIAMLFILVT